MSVMTAQEWIDYCNGTEPPQREMSADAIAENGIAFCSEDAKHWIMTPYDSRKHPSFRPKDIEPYLPLALVTKWGFNAVNVERLKELEKQLLAE